MSRKLVASFKSAGNLTTLPDPVEEMFHSVSVSAQRIVRLSVKEFESHAPDNLNSPMEFRVLP